VLYYVEYSIFGQKVRFKIDIDPNSKKVVINRIRVFYLFIPLVRSS
jgi:hypothetical protein